MKNTFTGYAKQVENFTNLNAGQHCLLFSKQFGAINEIVVSENKPHAYPKQIYYHYAHREQEREMALWLHELELSTVLFKIC